MRLGGPVWYTKGDADEWVAQHRAWGYGAAVFPLKHDAAPADAAGLVIGEVGAWHNNPISPDDATRRAGIAGVQAQLALAEEVGARCCVNVSGSRGDGWASPHPDNLTDDTFALVVDSAREIIDAVNPTRTRFALEGMPWAFPDGPDTYLRLVEAIDRPGFGVHFDPVNFVSTVRRWADTGALIRETVRLLGPHIVSSHAKDIELRSEALLQLHEVRPGLGQLDYVTLLRELDALSADLPVIIEHLPGEAEYRAAADHIKSVAASEGIRFVTVA
jgi:sugar phosphate isomerase/epimerase